MRKILLTLTIFLVALTISACTESVEHENIDIKEIVNEYSVGHFENITASITSDELIVTDEKNDETTTYKLPKDEFFVSIAPFINTTHPCVNHSLTSCQGELVEEDFKVYIEDEDGKVLVDETMTSLENGFIDLWLPREKTFKVKIEYEGMTSEQEISTFKGDNTCITTMRLM